jgi:CheY-like chemotaxis protein
LPDAVLFSPGVRLDLDLDQGVRGAVRALIGASPSTALGGPDEWNAAMIPAAAQQHLPVIYLVDDDAAVRRSTTFLLESCGFLVRSYACGIELLADRPGPHGCLVLDYHMPGMNGLELVERLREQRVELPVVLVTGGLDQGIEARALESGVLAIVEKPFLDNRLLEALERALY